MDGITRRYMHDVRIMPSMGKAETAANGWISNRPSVIQRFYRVSSTSDILLVEINQPTKRFAQDHLLLFTSVSFTSGFGWKMTIQSRPKMMSWSEDHMVSRLTYPTCRIGYE